MEETAVSQAFVVRRGEGDGVELGGLGVEFKISGQQTNGLLAVVEHPIAPGRLVPPHLHQDEDECSFVIAGTIGARIGDAHFEAGPGDYVWKPRGVPHTFWNPGPEPARVLEMIVPSGFENFFKETGRLNESGLPFEQLVVARSELARRYKHDFVEGWAEELKAAYGLRLLGE
jgi:quercetin dioxygenase-like cupin family protein